MSHRMNLTALRAVLSNFRVGRRTALRAVVPMSGVGQNLLHIRGGLLFTLLFFVHWDSLQGAQISGLVSSSHFQTFQMSSICSK